MKKIILILLCAITMGICFDTWYGNAGEYKINTGYDVGEDKSGYWFTYNDNADGGASTVSWPVPAGNEYDTSALDPVIDYCEGVCGKYTLDKGTLDYNPFIGVGFNLAGENDESADATDMNGICIAYTVDAAATLEMGLGNGGDAEIGYDNPAVALPKATTVNVKDIAWSNFKQAGWGKAKISGDEAATKLVALKFKIQGASGSSGNFNISAIGANGKCTDKLSIKKMPVLNNFNQENTIYNIKGDLIGKNKSKYELYNMPQGLYIINIGSKNYQFIVK